MKKAIYFVAQIILDTCYSRKYIEIPNIMKIRLLTFISIMFLSLATVTAQIREKGIFIEMNAGYGQVSYGDYHKGYAILSPALSYQFGTYWAAGVKAKFETGDYGDYTTVGAYTQYSFLNLHKLKLFAEGQISYSKESSDKDYIDPSYKYDNDYMEAGITFGGSYTLCNHLNFIARYLYIGYSDSPRRHEGAYLGSGRGIIDANLCRLQIGLQYIF